MAKTTNKRHKVGPNDGVKFSSENQPSPEAKKAGWEQFRKERHLTQSIIKMMLGEDGTPNETFKGYLDSLVKNAQLGNPKAIDAVNKCLEDEIIKVAATNSAGEDVQPVIIFQPSPNCNDISNPPEQ